MTKLAEGLNRAFVVARDVKEEIDNAKKPENKVGQAFGRGIKYYGEGVAYIAVPLVVLEAATLAGGIFTGPFGLLPVIAAPVVVRYAVIPAAEKVGEIAEKATYALAARVGLV
ncbi:MAG: hypothetical protein K940chlam3_00645 [Chlamydiae bacterium]|nr:hypothetical protein [Chlamydiota bacterium]